jgi:hypothetical protein
MQMVHLETIHHLAQFFTGMRVVVAVILLELVAVVVEVVEEHLLEIQVRINFKVLEALHLLPVLL